MLGYSKVTGQLDRNGKNRLTVDELGDQRVQGDLFWFIELFHIVQALFFFIIICVDLICLSQILLHLCLNKQVSYTFADDILLP